MRITINNFDNLPMCNVADAVNDLDIFHLTKVKCYMEKYTEWKFAVYYRKTKKGVAIDLHKLEYI